MNDGLIPRRYAKALLKFAQERHDDAKVYDLMKNLCAGFEAQPQLAQVLNNPFVDADSKRQLLLTAAGATKADSTLVDFIKLLIDNNRIGLARDIAFAYLSLYRKANNIFPVEITTAADFTPDQLSRLKALIEKHLGNATVEYHVSNDPDLIGGFTVNIGSERLDASLKNELKQLRLKLLNND